MASIHVDAARRWIGTPYRHQASALGVGCDCLGLVRGVWRETVGEEPERAPAYSPDWSEYRKDEQLWLAALRHLPPVDIDFGAVGDVVLFRVKRGAVAKHLGILAPSENGPRMIHAISGRAVHEVTLTPDWQARVVAQFAFPDRRF